MSNMKDFLTRWAENATTTVIHTLILLAFLAFVGGFCWLLWNLLISEYYWVALLFIFIALTIPYGKSR
jgi:hypothetical protein